MDVKGEIHSNTIIVENFNTQLTSIDPDQKTNKEIMTLNITLEEINLIDIYRTFHLKTAEYTFFSRVHRTFSRIDQN